MAAFNQVLFQYFKALQYMIPVGHYQPQRIDLNRIATPFTKPMVNSVSPGSCFEQAVSFNPNAVGTS